MIADKGAEIDILWKYDDGDDDIERIGLDYQKITSLSITPMMMEDED